MNTERKKRRILIPLLLLAAVLIALLFLPENAPAPEPDPVPPPPTKEELLTRFLNGCECPEDLICALSSLRLKDPRAVITFRDTELSLTCSAEDETGAEEPAVCRIWFSADGIDPSLVCFGIFEWTDDETVRCPEIGLTIQKDGSTLFAGNEIRTDGSSPSGICRTACGFRTPLADTIVPDREEDGTLVTEDGWYRVTLEHGKGTGSVGIVPLYLWLEETPDADVPFSFRLSWFGPGEMDDRICTVHFLSPAHDSPSGGSHGTGHGDSGGSSGNGSGGSNGNDTPSSPVHNSCSNSSNCNEPVFLCYWCKQYHCTYHKCEKRRAYNFWCSNELGGWDVSYYEPEYAHFIEGSGAANYQRWLPEFEAFGVRYNYDY